MTPGRRARRQAAPPAAAKPEAQPKPETAPAHHGEGMNSILERLERDAKAVSGPSNPRFRDRHE